MTFGRQLWSSVPEAAGTRIWFSASNGVGQSLAKGSNSCKDLPIASADASIKVKSSKSRPNGWIYRLRGGGRNHSAVLTCIFLFLKIIKKGRELNDDVVVDYASECAAAQSFQAGSSPVSSDQAKATGDIKLVASAVGEWLRPLARRRHGWVALKRVRLECSCHSAGSKGSPSPKSGPIIKPCANLRPLSQRRKVDFHYNH